MTTTAYTPPAPVTPAEPPMAPGEFDALRRDAEAAAAAEFAKVLAYYEPRAQAVTDALVRAAAERARLLDRPEGPAWVQAETGQVGICKGVGTNCDNRVVARVQEWKGGPFTAYAETLTVLTLDGKE